VGLGGQLQPDQPMLQPDQPLLQPVRALVPATAPDGPRPPGHQRVPTHPLFPSLSTSPPIHPLSGRWLAPMREADTGAGARSSAPMERREAGTCASSIDFLRLTKEGQ
jgi:hypothetical protein